MWLSKSPSLKRSINFDLRMLLAYNLNSNSWKRCSLPTQASNNMNVALIGCRGTLYACCRKGIEKYTPADDSWQIATTCQIRPCHLMVSDDRVLHFYNLRDGWVQKVRVDYHDNELDITQQQNLPPNRFFAGFTSVVKLRGEEVLVSLRTLTGIHRKLFSIRTNTWKDVHLWKGKDRMKQQPRFLDFSESLPMMCDRLTDDLYLLGSQSGFSDLSEGVDLTKLDAALPFFRYNMEKKTWTRLASLPEFMSAGSLETCCSDRLYNMAQMCTL